MGSLYLVELQKSTSLSLLNVFGTQKVQPPGYLKCFFFPSDLFCCLRKLRKHLSVFLQRFRYFDRKSYLIFSHHYLNCLVMRFLLSALDLVRDKGSWVGRVLHQATFGTLQPTMLLLYLLERPS
jgi:hypothetical protein